MRTARLLIDSGHSVTGIRRDVSKLPDWLNSISADVNRPDKLAFLSSQSFDIVLYCLAASGFNEAAYRSAYVDGLSNVLGALGDQTPERFIFVSSTSVYHQNDGSVVDEQSPTTPGKFNGRIVLEGETLVRSRANGTVVRFSGIYGPGRTRMIDRVKSHIRSDPHDEGYTNRIHVDDCAGVLAHIADLTSRHSAESLYLASDSLPCTRYELEAFIASELGIGAAPAISAQDGEQAVASAAGARRIAGSKRCSNARLLQSGYRFKFPDYTFGYKQVLLER